MRIWWKGRIFKGSAANTAGGGEVKSVQTENCVNRQASCLGSEGSLHPKITTAEQV